MLLSSWGTEGRKDDFGGESGGVAGGIVAKVLAGVACACASSPSRRGFYA
jgi:hypothetical protein